MEIPDKVKSTLKRLKEAHGNHYLRLAAVGNHYYVSEYTVHYDKLSKKNRVTVKYLGRIITSGEFIPASKKSRLNADVTSTLSEPVKTAAERLRNQHNKIYIMPINKKAYVYAIRPNAQPKYIGVIEEDGTYVGENIETKEVEEKDFAEAKFKKYDERILTVLSMNSRASIPFIAKKVGLSSSSTAYRIKKLEDKYDIKYSLDLRIGAGLGYLEFAIFVKFKDKMPPLEEIKNQLTKDSRVQLVATLNGAYDLFIYYVTETAYTRMTGALEVVNKIYETTQNALAKYSAEWLVTPFSRSYGLAPLRDTFFDLLKNKVWSKSKDFPKPIPGQITKREYVVLKELYSNSKADFTSIDEKYGFDKGASYYTYSKLKEKKIINFATINIQKPPIKYIAIIYLTQTNIAEFLTSREVLLASIIENMDYPINKYLLVGDVLTPQGITFVLPVIRDQELSDIESFLSRIKGTVPQTSIIKQLLIGNFAYIRQDNKYTRMYDTLVSEYKHPIEKLENYEQ